jgi:glutathione S-transferase
MAERVVPEEVWRRLELGPGLTLVQHPISPFCIAIRAMLAAAEAPFRTLDVALWDRRPVIALTDGAYDAVPVLVDGDRTPPVVAYEARDDGMDIARYLDARLDLGLFPDEFAGLQELVVQYIERQVEDVGFRANDAFFLLSFPDVVERTMYVRHKERKFGKGCVEQWRTGIDGLRARMAEVLTPLDRMLARHPFVLGEWPTYADYALFGVLGNYTFSGDNELPAELGNLRRWYEHLPEVRIQ